MRAVPYIQTQFLTHTTPGYSQPNSHTWLQARQVYGLNPDTAGKLGRPGSHGGHDTCAGGPPRLPGSLPSIRLWPPRLRPARKPAAPAIAASRQTICLRPVRPAQLEQHPVPAENLRCFLAYVRPGPRRRVAGWEPRSRARLLTPAVPARLCAQHQEITGLYGRARAYTVAILFFLKQSRGQYCTWDDNHASISSISQLIRYLRW